jgi:hypothetical protein
MVWDTRISQPRQKPGPDQWEIRSGSGEAREPIGKGGRARRGQEGKGQQESGRKKRPWLNTASTWTTASNSRTPASYPPNIDTWIGWSGRPLKSNYNRTTWTGRMVFAWAGHGSPSSTLSKDVGSVWYSLASPDLATRPTHCPFQGTTWPQPFPYFLSVIPSNFSPSFHSLSSSLHPMYMRWPTSQYPRGPEKGRFFLPLSCCPFPSWPRLARPLFPIGSLASPDPDLIPHWSGPGFCLGWLIPISQTVSTNAAYSSPWLWRQQGPLKR